MWGAGSYPGGTKSRYLIGVLGRYYLVELYCTEAVLAWFLLQLMGRGNLST